MFRFLERNVVLSKRFKNLWEDINAEPRRCFLVHELYTLK